MDLPMDVAFEVSFTYHPFKDVDAPNLNALPDCHVSRSKGSPAPFPALEAI